MIICQRKAQKPLLRSQRPSPVALIAAHAATVRIVAVGREPANAIAVEPSRLAA